MIPLPAFSRPLVAMMVLVAPAEACFTPQRAEVLQKTHPDRDFVTLSHHMHHQQPIDYEFLGPAPCVDGQAAEFPCRGIELAGWLNLTELGADLATTGSDNWGWRDSESGRLFALMGRSDGVSFVEMTDPADPVLIGHLPRPEGVASSVWTDLKTYRDHLFVVADTVTGQGLQVFDLRRLLNPAEPLPLRFDADAHYTGFNAAHNLAINEQTGFAYAVGGDACSGGLNMIDIRDPLEPAFAGCFDEDGYTHDVQCVLYQGPDERYRGQEICFASNEDTLTIVDVTDKANPRLIERHAYPRSAYTHQGWLTADQRFFVLDDELDEVEFDLTGTRTLIFDFERLDVAPAPAEYVADGLAIDHNQYVFDGFTFQANYERGLRILRIDDPKSADLTEVAYFDTHPEADGLRFRGAWNVFPFFGNGLLLVSDFNRGLFVLRVTDPDLLEALKSIFRDRYESV
ncbi:MAG: choice-of-anchor B family protein [Wenzhouxiangella sp.]|nr:choice-of-anchor B family protein [Wenzhouxiangella sp.]